MGYWYWLDGELFGRAVGIETVNLYSSALTGSHPAMPNSTLLQCVFLLVTNPRRHHRADRVRIAGQWLM